MDSRPFPDTGSVRQAICDIVIPIWNRPELTQRCLVSLLRFTPEPSIRLILIDNGSETPTRQMLKRFKEQCAMTLTLIENPANLGFIQAVNQGVRTGSAPWVLILNNDTVVTPGWLSEMIRVAESHPKIGLVNPTSNSLGFTLGNLSPEEMAERLKSETGKWTDLSTALGFCLLARRQVWERLGGFDEAFGMGYFEDDDLSRRVRQLGLRCVRACGSYVWHEERGSFRHLAETDKAFQRNRRLFEQRWGRRLRILWAGAPLPEVVLLLVDQGHWITFVTTSGDLPQAVASCSQVSFLATQRSAWRGKALLRLLTKRKKPFDLVISFDPVWSRWVRNLTWYHRAQLMESPSTEEVLGRCRILCRFPSS